MNYLSLQLNMLDQVDWNSFYKEGRHCRNMQGVIQHRLFDAVWVATSPFCYSSPILYFHIYVVICFGRVDTGRMLRRQTLGQCDLQLED